MLDYSAIKTYPGLERSALIERLADVTTQLASLTEAWWTMQADEVRTKAEAFIDSTAESIAGKERDVNLATYHISASVLETRGQVDALKEERNYLVLLIGR